MRCWNRRLENAQDAGASTAESVGHSRVQELEAQLAQLSFEEVNSIRIHLSPHKRYDDDRISTMMIVSRVHALVHDGTRCVNLVTAASQCIPLSGTYLHAPPLKVVFPLRLC
jgi:hypothetical protein